jgi:16S rRNA C1402 N4-methylase RsmH
MIALLEEILIDGRVPRLRLRVVLDADRVEYVRDLRRRVPVEIAELAAKFALVFNGSQSPSEAEVEENSRAASVRLRAIERVAA